MKNIPKKTKNVEMTEQFCHSFWRSECENRNIECYRCKEFYAEPLKKYQKACERANKKNE